MIFLGDAHFVKPGYWATLPSDKAIYQVGDMEIGLSDLSITPRENVKFIRGNHDNPALCRTYPNYLGEFGIHGDVFFVSGANSYDKHKRIPGVTWFEDEELTMAQSYECLDLYEQTKPEIVMSHDGPRVSLNEKERIFTLREPLRPLVIQPTRTSQLLDQMLEIHQPKYWIHGHHHFSHQTKIGNTLFVSLNILEMFEI